MSLRAAAGALALAIVLAAGGCGGDDEEPETTATSSPRTEETTTAETEQTTPEPEATEKETAPRPAPETETETEAEPPAPSPEEQPGGAGDEEPARSLAQFTVKNGRVTPRVVRVPAFISIRVELRADDGNTYALTIGGKVLAVAERVNSVSATLDGLRPGAAYVGTLVGAAGPVRIEATAEPGP